jgi:hypothetical protein
MNLEQGGPTMSRRGALAVAAMLAATVLTGGAAILGIVYTPAPGHAPVAAVVQAAQPAPTHWEEGGD